MSEELIYINKEHKRGYIVLDNESMLVWEQCPICYKTTHGVLPIQALHASLTCEWCKNVVNGVPLPSVQERINYLGFDPWKEGYTQ